MKRVLCTSLSLLVLTAFAFALPLLRPTAAAPTPPPPPPPERKIDVLRGDAAKNHVEKLKTKNKALRRALKDMEKLGRTPNWENSAVLRTIESPVARKASPLGPGGLGSMKSSFAQSQDYGNDGNGSEMTIITTSTDYDPYWVGTIQTYDATTNTYGTYSGVIDNTVIGDTTNDSADVVDELFYPQDGSAPIREEPPYGGGDGGCGSERVCPLLDIIASKSVPPTKGGEARMVNASYAAKAAPAAGIIGWFKRYFRCLRRCTAMFALQCAPVLTQPAPAGGIGPYFLCVAIRSAIAGSIACAFNTRSCGG